MIGLSTGLACVLLIFLWVNDELGVDYGLLELMGIEMAAGRTYSRSFADTSSIIFNEAAIAAMGIEDPIGKRIRFRHKDYHIIGVAILA